jgi:hypothetical protein
VKVPLGASDQPDSLRTDLVETSEVSESRAKEAAGRKDRGRRHAMRASVLSRSLIHTLERHGENVRALRKIERELLAALKPRGAPGRLLFDRLWASILRLILAARLEESALVATGIDCEELSFCVVVARGRSSDSHCPGRRKYSNR